VQKWGGNHPKVITKGGGGLQHPDMKLGLTLGFLSFTLLALVLIWLRMRVAHSAARLSELEQEALELGVDED
jgi:heme exporter protein C